MAMTCIEECISRMCIYFVEEISSKRKSFKIKSWSFVPYYDFKGILYFCGIKAGRRENILITFTNFFNIHQSTVNI